VKRRHREPEQTIEILTAATSFIARECDPQRRVLAAAVRVDRQAVISRSARRKDRRVLRRTGERARDQDSLAGVTERPHSWATSAKNARYAGSSPALIKVISDWPRKVVFFFIS
jgi:hypothetical protein